MQFTHWAVQAKTVYGSQLRFGPYTILAWTAQSVNCQYCPQSHVLFVNCMVAHVHYTQEKDMERYESLVCWWSRTHFMYISDTNEDYL